ncbi:MAG: hypothetical protein GX754_08560 [Clostridiaceae bacterium]|nr:hypothetical protein [Clostridiaceae bacterium]
MEVKFKYSKYIDLVFHVLAHMHVNNASDLFSQKYIGTIQKEKHPGDVDLPTEIRPLEQYYNNNFERLGMINFLPFYSDSLNELKQILFNYNGFNKDDINEFVTPFIDLLEREATFYYEYWEKQHKTLHDRINVVESQMERLLKNYKCIFDYYKKSALVYFSISITRNGRGFSGIKNYFSAVIPFPTKQQEFVNSFFTLLHEYTHQFTDRLLNTNISMQDGSHNMSENIVMLFDYHLIKAVNSTHKEAYINRLAKLSGNDGVKITETGILKIFDVPREINNNILDLLGTILLV